MSEKEKFYEITVIHKTNVKGLFTVSNHSIPKLHLNSELHRIVNKWYLDICHYDFNEMRNKLEQDEPFDHDVFFIKEYLEDIYVSEILLKCFLIEQNIAELNKSYDNKGRFDIIVREK